MTGAPQERLDPREQTVVASWARAASAAASGSDLAPAVVARVQEAVLDHLGVLVAGASSPAAVALADLVPTLEGGSVAVGSGRTLDPVSAATANAAAAHALDLDDGSRAAAGHPGAVVIPAAIAAAEPLRAPGGRLVRAIALGYELFVRLGTAVNPAHLRRGFHTTATVGPLAAAIAASAARGHDEATLRRALSLAGLLGAGLLEVTVDGAEAKPIQVGRAAGAGVQAALLAERGIGGPARTIEGSSGFLAALVGEPVDPDRLALDPGCAAVLACYVKRHACCRHNHAAIDAVLRLRDRLGALDGARLTVGTYQVALDICSGPAAPASIEEARFSLPFTVALAAVQGDVDALTVRDERPLRDDRVVELATRTELVLDPELERRYPEQRGAYAVARLPGGGSERETVLGARGEPEDPLSPAELDAKFGSLLSSAGVRDGAARELRSRVEDLPALAGADELLRPLAGWRATA